MDNGRSWWATLVQGIVAILLGLYILFGGDAAAGNVILVAGLYILIVGILALFRGSDDAIGRYQGIVSVIVGALVLLLYAVDILPTFWDFTVFAVGAIIVGVLGLYSNFFDRRGKDFSWGPVLVNALLVLWGIMIFFSRMQNFDLQFITALILIVMGVIFVIWGFIHRGDGDSTEFRATPKDTSE